MLQNKIIATRRATTGRLYEPIDCDVQLSNGNTVAWSYIDGPDIAVVLAIHDGHVLMKREWRLSQQRDILELASGRIDAGETPEQSAARELHEELGAAGMLVHLATVPLWNHASVRAHIFIATDIRLGDATPDADEIIHHQRVPLAGIISHVRAAGTNAQTLLALLLAKEKGFIE
jgi:8-oxo-dGTP pyrophosphatase MutT (NUDIX family)